MPRWTISVSAPEPEQKVFAAAVDAIDDAPDQASRQIAGTGQRKRRS